MDTVILLEGLAKFYGRQRGVIDLDLEVEAGTAFGYLGPNGAGKSTTIRLLLDLIHSTGGTARLFGLDTHTHSMAIRRRVGYLPSDPSLYSNLTGQEFLVYTANLKGGVEWSRIKGLANRLECDLTRNIGTLSHGNRQKVAVIRAFMHEPELLLLDEPTSGLDPLMQQEFVRMVREVVSDGRTVFLSSHILPEVEELCTRVGIIREGRLVAVEEVATLKSRSVRSLEVRFRVRVPAEAFEGISGVGKLILDDRVLRCEVAGPLDGFIKTVARYEVIDMKVREPSLEEVFLALYGGGKIDAAA